jgi:predicted ester cyclase
MTTEGNKAVVRTFYDAINRQDFGALAQYCHDDFIFYHQMDTPHHGVEGFIASEKKNFDAFADWQMPIREMPTGSRLRFSLLMLLTLKDGKIIEKRAHLDRLDIRNQLSH